MILDGMALPGRGYGTLEPLPKTLGQRGSPCFLSTLIMCARVGAGAVLCEERVLLSQMLLTKPGSEIAPPVSFTLSHFLQVYC